MLCALRRLVLAVLLITMLGTGAELILTGHTEGGLQLTPLFLLVASAGVLLWHAIAPRPASIRALRVIMLLFMSGGLVGVVVHGQSKLEFKREIDPSLKGIHLFWESLKSQSPPALAPGVFIQMGLLGLAFTYRHPALGSRRNS